MRILSLPEEFRAYLDNALAHYTECPGLPFGSCPSSLTPIFGVRVAEPGSMLSPTFRLSFLSNSISRQRRERRLPARRSAEIANDIHR